jgi:hypothetical protein
LYKYAKLKNDDSIKKNRIKFDNLTTGKIFLLFSLARSKAKNSAELSRKVLFFESLLILKVNQFDLFLCNVFDKTEL